MKDGGLCPVSQGINPRERVQKKHGVHLLYFVVTLSVFFLILLLLVLFTWRNGISPMPTSEKVRRALLEHLPEIEKGTIFELGSGWGNLAFPLSKKYPQCKIIAYENSPIPYLFSSLLNHSSNLKIIRHDFFEKSLQDASLVVCYLFPKGMGRLKEKLEKELRPETLVISHTFAIPGWKPVKTIETSDLYRSKIYFYKVL